MAKPTWDQVPEYNAANRNVVARAVSAASTASEEDRVEAVAVEHELQQQAGDAWVATGPKRTPDDGKLLAFEIAPSDTAVVVRVVANEVGDDNPANVLESAPVTVPGVPGVSVVSKAVASPPAPEPAAAPPASRVPVLAAVLFAVVLVAPAWLLLGVWARDGRTGRGYDSAVVAAVIALCLLSAGLAIAIGGLYLLGRERRRPVAAAPVAGTTESGMVSEPAKANAAWAVMAAAAAVLVASAWVGVHLADRDDARPGRINRPLGIGGIDRPRRLDGPGQIELPNRDGRPTGNGGPRRMERPARDNPSDTSPAPLPSPSPDDEPAITDAPTDAAPSDTAPSDTVPADAAPADTVPGDDAPLVFDDSTVADTAAGSVAAVPDTVPVVLDTVPPDGGGDVLFGPTTTVP